VREQRSHRAPDGGEEEPNNREGAFALWIKRVCAIVIRVGGTTGYSDSNCTLSVRSAATARPMSAGAPSARGLRVITLCIHTY